MPARSAEQEGLAGPICRCRKKEVFDTPFPIEGVVVRSAEDVAKLQRTCSHVWVDVERGAAPELRYYAFEAPAPAKPKPDEFDRLRSTRWQIQTEFASELRQAEQVHASVEASLQEVMRDLQEGKRLDVEKLMARAGKETQ